MSASNPPARPRRTWSRVALPVVVSLAAFGLFTYQLIREPHFVDESAYISQSGYADLLIDDRDHMAWLDYAGFDLPPLPKYLIGASLYLNNHQRPPTRAAWLWYVNTSQRFETDAALEAARAPSALLGAVGCLAIFAIGRRILDWRLGLIAAGLLAINPLYFTHARRAMSDVPAEAFGLLALAWGLSAWERFLKGGFLPAAWLEVAAAGVAVGLSVLSKLNGVISGVALGAWILLGLAIPLNRVATWNGAPRRGAARMKLSLVAALAVAAVLSFVVFVALNPFLTAQPKGSLINPALAEMRKKSFGQRAFEIYNHRVQVSLNGQRSFPNDALPTLVDKVKVVAAQGLGRFSPFGPRRPDSRVRFDLRQDWGAIVWGPLCLAGLVLSLRLGRSQLGRGEPPSGWALAILALVSTVLVTGFIPLAWDRYLISIQPGYCLLGALALVRGVDALRARSST